MTLWVRISFSVVFFVDVIPQSNSKYCGTNSSGSVQVFRIARWALQAAKTVFVQTLEQIKVFVPALCFSLPGILFCMLCKKRSDLALSVDVGVN